MPDEKPNQQTEPPEPQKDVRPMPIQHPDIIEKSVTPGKLGESTKGKSTDK